MDNISSLFDDAIESSGSTLQPPQQQPPQMNSVQQVILRIVYGIIGSVGIVDNLFVILVFVCFTDMANKTMSMLVVHQSIVDTLPSFATLAAAVVKVDPYTMTRGNVYDEIICRVWMSTAYLFVMPLISTYGMVLITLDRYLAVIYPVWYKNSAVKKRRLMYSLIAVIWIIAPATQFGIRVPKAAIVNGTCVPFGVLDSHVAERAVGVMGVLTGYALPTLAMVFCYSRVVCSLKYKVGPLASGSSFSAASRNALVTSLLVCCGFLICWTPVLVMHLARFAFGVPLADWAHYLFVMLMLANSCVNPLIYAAKYGEFQNGVSRLAAKIRKKPIQPQQQSSHAVSRTNCQTTV